MPRDRRQVDELISELVKRIQAMPEDPGLDRKIEALAARCGEWVMDAIADQLTDGSRDSISPWKASNLLGVGIQSSPLQAGPIFVTEWLENGMDLVDVLRELVAGDFYKIPREAHMTRIEAEVWGYWTQGRNVGWMLLWVHHPNGVPYTRQGLAAVLKRTCEKVRNCPWLGWRTCLAEDIARGKHRRGVSSISASEIMPSE